MQAGLAFRNIDRPTRLFEIRSAQLYSVFYYESGWSLAAGNAAGKLKKPRRRKLARWHLMLGTFHGSWVLRAGSFNFEGSLTGWAIVISFFMPLILCATVVASVSIGVIAAYTVVIGILQVCAHASRPRPVEVRPRLVLVPTQTHASGD
jgi:hypothetical protein